MGQGTLQPHAKEQKAGRTGERVWREVLPPPSCEPAKPCHHSQCKQQGQIPVGGGGAGAERGVLFRDGRGATESPGRGLPEAVSRAGWGGYILPSERRAPSPDGGCHPGRQQMGKATRHKVRRRRQGERRRRSLQTERKAPGKPERKPGSSGGSGQDGDRPHPEQEQRRPPKPGGRTCASSRSQGLERHLPREARGKPSLDELIDSFPGFTLRRQDAKHGGYRGEREKVPALTNLTT